MVTRTLLSLLTLLHSANAQDYCSKRSAAEDKCEVEPTIDPEARFQTTVLPQIYVCILILKLQVRLSNGLRMPMIGYGTWKVVGDEVRTYLYSFDDI